MKQGDGQAEGSTLVVFRLPKDVSEALEKAVVLEDCDQTQFIQNAVQEKLRKMGYDTPKNIT